MAKCWTCGSVSENASYRCVVCEGLLAVPRMEQHLSSIRHEFGGTRDKLAASIEDASEALGAVVSGEFDRVAAVLEWGVEELSWQMRQATVVIRSIDERLRTPIQVGARERREMGEMLASRGEQQKAEEFLTQSLELNPLDYRTYIELAFVKIRANDFVDARTILEGSLAHAPKTDDLDYKSYSYRLIAHTYACESNNFECLRSLSEALALSPEYPDAHFDLVQVVASSSDDEITDACSELFNSWSHNWRLAVQKRDYALVCWMSLVKAVKANPVLYYVAARDKRFDGRRTVVDNALANHLRNTLASAQVEVSLMSGDLEEVDERMFKLKRSLLFRLWRSMSSETRRYGRQLEDIQAEIQETAAISDLTKKMQSGDYFQALQARLESAVKKEKVSMAKEKFYQALQEKWYWMLTSPR